MAEIEENSVGPVRNSTEPESAGKKGEISNGVGIVQTKTMRVIERDGPLELECGKTLGPIDVAYETYGELNEAGDNAVLICHALSSNAHVAG